MRSEASVLILLVAVIGLLFAGQTVYASSNQASQPSQASVSVNLTNLKVQLTYPSQAQPGQSVTVTVQGVAENSFKLDNLNLLVYVANPSQLLQVANITIAKNLQMYAKGQFSKSVQVAVPSDAQRTSLIAKLSENIETSILIIYNNVEAAPYYTTISADAITPLTYIEATTPEYSALQAQYQALQSNFNKVQQSLNQTQAQNHQLQTTITQQSATISQQNDKINQLNGQLNDQLATSAQTFETYEAVGIVAAVVAIVMAALAAFSIYHARKKRSSFT